MNAIITTVDKSATWSHAFGTKTVPSDCKRQIEFRSGRSGRQRASANQESPTARSGQTIHRSHRADGVSCQTLSHGDRDPTA
jgi:hypothetical protein